MSARVIVDGAGAQVAFPYDRNLIDIVKTVPGRQWVKAEKYWAIPARSVDLCADALRAAGQVVYVTRPDGSTWTSGRQTHGTRGTPDPDWAASLLAAVGSDLQDAAYRALSKVLHPDVGGDTRLMQDLNRARDDR
jgi:hypothetical protein